MTRLLSAFALVAVLAAPAAAYQAEPFDGPPEGPLHSVSITISPIHLILPVVEVQAELALDEQIGVSLILGFGSVAVSDGFTNERFSVFEVGGQFEYYALGDFDHGLQLGAELLYLGVSAGADSQFGGVFGRGLSLAPSSSATRSPLTSASPSWPRSAPPSSWCPPTATAPATPSRPSA